MTVQLLSVVASTLVTWAVLGIVIALLVRADKRLQAAKHASWRVEGIYWPESIHAPAGARPPVYEPLPPEVQQVLDEMYAHPEQYEDDPWPTPVVTHKAWRHPR